MIAALWAAIQLFSSSRMRAALVPMTKWIVSDVRIVSKPIAMKIASVPGTG